MRITRGFWEVAALGLVLTILALLLEAPSLLVASAVLGGWLIATQWTFLGAVRELERTITVEQTVSPRHVAPGETVSLSLEGRRRRDPSLDVTVAIDLPPTVRLTDSPLPRIHLGDLEVATTATAIELPVAGIVELPSPTVSVSDARDLFETSFHTGEAIEIVAEPRQPGPIHIGAGGEGIATAYGEHEGGPFGSGLTPEELREYVPGDPADRIDWKAMARLGDPYVREFESETDLESAIVFDRRAPMGIGPAGATKLAYAREVALAYLSHARDLGDPLGLYVVGGEGVTHRRRPAEGGPGYDWIRRTLLQLTPTGDLGDEETGSPSLPPERARQLAHRLAEDEHMGPRLRPFLLEADRYVQRIRERPLFGSVQLVVNDLRDHRRCVLITDDTNRTEVRETVKLARRHGGQVLLFLVPGALFSPGGLADLDETYRAYLDFEEFRRDLDGLERVRAMEVAPGDRLGAVLTAADRRRART